MNQITKEHFCFKNFKILKNKYGIDFLINKLNVHSGTIKRWIEKKQIPFQYNFYLQKINDCLNNEQSKKQIDIFNNPLQKRKFDEFYTTEKTVDWCFETLKKELQKLDIDFNEYFFINHQLEQEIFIVKCLQIAELELKLIQNLIKIILFLII